MAMSTVDLSMSLYRFDAYVLITPKLCELSYKPIRQRVGDNQLDSISHAGA